MPKQEQVPHSDVKFKGKVRRVTSTLTVTSDREIRPFTKPSGSLNPAAVDDATTPYRHDKRSRRTPASHHPDPA